MASKITITVEKLEDGVYRIVAEDDVAVAKYTTGAPRAILQDIFNEFKINGKRGRPVGSGKKKPEHGFDANEPEIAAAVAGLREGLLAE